ncbi:MAG: acyltransferase [Candidatus Hodarchaeota archaeon]
MVPGSQFRALLLRWAGYQIGEKVYIGADLIIVDEPEDVGAVFIGDRVAVSPRVTIVVSSRPNNSKIASYAPVAHGPVRIMQDAWIGVGSIILPNVTIGEGAIVGAGSIVTKDVSPYTVVVGSPAKSVGKVDIPKQIEKEKSGGN